jgi:hypothetical protein
VSAGNSGVSIGKTEIRTDPAWEHYDIDKENKKWNCKLCGNEFTYSTDGPSITIAKGHLYSVHPDLWMTLRKRAQK